MMPEILTESIKNADAIVSSMKRLNKKISKTIAKQMYAKLHYSRIEIKISKDIFL